MNRSRPKLHPSIRLRGLSATALDRLYSQHVLIRHKLIRSSSLVGGSGPPRARVASGGPEWHQPTT